MSRVVTLTQKQPYVFGRLAATSWLSGSALVSINEVTLRRARLKPNSITLASSQLAPNQLV